MPSPRFGERDRERRRRRSFHQRTGYGYSPTAGDPEYLDEDGAAHYPPPPDYERARRPRRYDDDYEPGTR